MDPGEKSSQPCRDAQTLPQQTTEIPTVLETIKRYFLTGRESLTKYSDEDIQQISELLRPLNSEWSNVPRLYIVLRTIGHLHILDSFIAQGITDLWFPFSVRGFPLCVNQNVCRAFLEAQWIVLTKAIDLEKGEQGRHQYFVQDELFPFKSHGFLGSGAFSAVDRVVSLHSGAQYARKRIRRGDLFHRAKKSMESFSNELQVLKQAQHHHIVELIGSYTDPVFVGLLFSPVADMNLTEFYLLASESSSDKNLLRTFFGCLSNGLSYLHGIKIRHRDIKPENILVKGETVLLADFNISVDWKDAENSMTNDTIPLMTRRYGAPEMLNDEPRGSASDIWSLGCVFLEIVTVLKGRNPTEMKAFFENYGSQSIIFANNLDAIKSWMVTLRVTNGADIDDLPLEWVQQMLKKTSGQRITAEVLAKKTTMVRKTGSSSVTFCGRCCCLDEERPSEVGFGRADSRDVAPIFMEETSNISQPAFVSPSRCSKLAPVSLEEAASSSGRSQMEVESRPAKRERSLRSSKVALFAAIKNGDTQQVSLLIESGADIESEDVFGRRALFKAVESGSDAVVSILLAKLAHVNAKTVDGLTALHEAAKNGLTGIVKLLVEKGADTSIQTTGGWTALYFAVMYEKLGCVRQLMKAGTNPDVQTDGGLTALHGAVWSGNVDIIKMLLDGNAKPNLEDSKGTRPIHLAAALGHGEIVRLLIDNGADINVAESRFGFDPLMLASDLGREAVVQLLLERGANQMYRDPKDGASALDLAAKAGHAKIARALINAGWAVNAVNNYGCTPLVTAACKGHDACLQVLLDGGGDMDVPAFGGNTALYFAAEKGHAESVRLLINNGADVHASNAKGLTALHAAAAEGHAEVAKVLLEYGADSNATGNDGPRPIDLAEAGGHEGVVELLESVSEAVV